jgi:hypothetical protein
MKKDIKIGEINPFKHKSCYDCGYLYARISWWCGNEKAIEARGTAIPGCEGCPYWKPDWKYIEEKYKTPENGYKPVSWWQRIWHIK